MAASRAGKGFRFKPPSLGFRGKVLVVALLGISFVVFWSLFSSPPANVGSRRSSFGDIEHELGGRKGSSPAQHVPAGHRTGSGRKKAHPPPPPHRHRVEQGKGESGVGKGRGEGGDADGEGDVSTVIEDDGKEEDGEEPGKESGTPGDLEGGVEGDAGEELLEEKALERARREQRRIKTVGPLFVPGVQYNWKPCSGASGRNYIPCVDLEGAGSGKLVSHRHRERSCPAVPPMCLTPLPQGYEFHIPWPESQRKIVSKNVAHPMLSAYIKTQTWLQQYDEYLLFPKNESLFKGGPSQYLDFISDLVPDIDWGKNIRIVLDIGCTDSSFATVLIEKDVLVLSLGLMNDQTDLAQVSLERGFPAIVGKLGRRRLPFPSGVFDVIHCGDCDIPWHSNDGKLILEMNRILRPGGYFMMSFRHGDVEGEEVITKLTATICWSTLAHNTNEDTDLSLKIYQRPSSNNVYEVRTTKNPPICKESENRDAAWYEPIKSCLHTIPASFEQRGTDWPEDWPKRLETFPEWLTDSQEKVLAESEHWKAIVNNSYLNGMGIDWSQIRNVMDMKAIHGGFAAALTSQNVWVMNVVPVHAPDTLPVIFERGLIGIYHDWCEPFSTYPRSYDLLHADHLFARLKNRCSHPVGIVVEMDRILRPGGWAIIRDKVEILNPLEAILRSMNWDIVMTFSQNNQGIICAQKSIWRP